MRMRAYALPSAAISRRSIRRAFLNFFCGMAADDRIQLFFYEIIYKLLFLLIKFICYLIILHRKTARRVAKVQPVIRVGCLLRRE